MRVFQSMNADALSSTATERQAGFTLLEMAIVTALLGLLVSGGLFGLTTYREGIAQRTTLENLDKIERALGLYAVQHGGLPCPDIDADGVGEYDGDACVDVADVEVGQGTVPYVDMGLQRDEVLDGWKRMVSYAITGGFGTDPDGTDGSMPESGYLMHCDGGDIDYSTIATSGRIEPLTTPVSDAWPDSDPPRAAYALISHGSNGFGAVLPSGAVFNLAGGNDDEQHNAQSNGERDGTAGGREAQEIAANAVSTGFDDIVRARTPAQILYEIGCNSGAS